MAQKSEKRPRLQVEMREDVLATLDRVAIERFKTSKGDLAREVLTEFLACYLADEEVTGILGEQYIVRRTHGLIYGAGVHYREQLMLLTERGEVSPPQERERVPGEGLQPKYAAEEKPAAVEASEAGSWAPDEGIQSESDEAATKERLKDLVGNLHPEQAPSGKQSIPEPTKRR